MIFHVLLFSFPGPRSEDGGGYGRSPVLQHHSPGAEHHWFIGGGHCPGGLFHHAKGCDSRICLKFLVTATEDPCWEGGMQLKFFTQLRNLRIGHMFRNKFVQNSSMQFLPHFEARFECVFSFQIWAGCHFSTQHAAALNASIYLCAPSPAIMMYVFLSWK